MKKKVSIIKCTLLLVLLTSCGRIEQSSTDIGEPPSTSSQQESESETEETTTEWINPYAENHRIVSRQELDIDWGEYFLNDLVMMHKYYESDKDEYKEICFAIVTLMKVGETTGSDNEVPIHLKVERVLEKGISTDLFVEGVEIETSDETRWILLEDGTYEVAFQPTKLSIVEVGSQYVVYMVKRGEEVETTCMSLPFDYEGNYVSTVATGQKKYEACSDQVLWYYDINPTYYYEHWNDQYELMMQYKDNGFDVFDKKFPFWAADGIVY